ncbi:MAG: tRNA 5-methoxyuridine(34)/uridine 5-oxyacetic acid(34) synthase CmoB [Pseudomonadota bacterium]
MPEQLRQRLEGALGDHYPAPLRATLLAATARFSSAAHGDYARWAEALDTLPRITPVTIDTSMGVQLCASRPVALNPLMQALRQFRPWRKGPFDLFGLGLDTEWRSDWKWDRVAGAVNWTDAHVLDVGCGNGYFGWRMLGAGATQVIGIDPTLLFCMQHLAIDHFASGDPRCRERNWVLPLPLEALPADGTLESLEFDLTLSMGVLYHRRDPAEHLRSLYRTLRPGGTLLLETLVVATGPDLEPARHKQRYAQMRNVWIVPRAHTVLAWLAGAGFSSAACIDLSPTSVAEQHTTAWMRFDSLPTFLDAEDPTQTREGWPAPLRALFLAHRPA